MPKKDILLCICLINKYDKDRSVTEGKIEGKIEVTGRRERRSKQPLNDLRETRGYCTRSHCMGELGLEGTVGLL